MKAGIDGTVLKKKMSTSLESCSSGWDVRMVWDIKMDFSMQVSAWKPFIFRVTMDISIK